MMTDPRAPEGRAQQSQSTLQGQVVLITGGTRGIGKAIALRLAREKPRHLVLGYHRDHESARQTLRDLKELGVPASSVAGHLGQLDSIEELFANIAERFGKLDVFISNAARGAFRDATALSARSWQQTMDINARAFLIASQKAAELMPEAGGRIIALSSLGSRFCPPGYAALGSAKAALEALARYLAVELAPRGISVNVVCGGLIDTESVRLHPEFEQIERQVAERTPAGRIGRPEDLAGIVAFLCSPDAYWIRGQTLVADGGFSLLN